MKTTHQTLSMLTKWILAQIILVGTILCAHAQINASDPSLVLWLKASSIAATNTYGAGIAGPYVTNWLGSSSYKTLFVPPPLPSGDTGTETNRTPQLITVTNDGDVFQAVRFLQGGDPLTGGTNNYADRMWQTNNLGASDPTLIPASSNMTLVVVYRNDDPNAALGPSQCIFAKRGPSSCPYEFGLDASPTLISHDFITYSGQTVFQSATALPSQPEWGIIIMSVTAQGANGTGDLTFEQYYPSLGGWVTDSQAVTRGGDSIGIPCTLGFHVQGAGGSASNPWGNGTYERFGGAIAQLALYNRTLSSNELAGIQNALLLKYFLQPGPPTFTTQPTNQTVQALQPATFSVVANGTPPFTYQWMKNGAPISGANSAMYTIPSVVLSDGGNYSCVVSNSISFATTTNALLTVIPAPAPKLISALRDYANDAYVTITYSQPVSKATATNIANYSINNGVSISGVVVVTNSISTVNTNYFSSFVLTTSGVTTAPTILTVKGGVQNLAGTIIATNSQATIPVPGAIVGAPPTKNLLMWLASDQFVYTTSLGVYEWDDQSANANNVYATSSGDPQLGVVAFPNGMHQAIHFNGTTELQVANSAAFSALTNFTIYVVGDVNNTKKSMEWVGDWTGLGLGISDGVAGRIKYITYQPNNANDNIEPSSGADLGNYVPYFIEGSFVDYGEKSLYVDGNLVGTESTNSGVNIASGAVLTIGALAGGNTQPLVGDVEEVLIYSGVSAAQDAAIKQYLASKYFSPSATLPALVAATLNTSTNVTLSFSEPVSADTATNIANYGITQGVNVIGATLVNLTNVVLTTAPISGGQNYSITVNNVSDWAGNAIATNSQIAIGGIPAPTIDIMPQGASIAVTWSASTNYVLQSAPSVAGPWVNVTNAASPFVVTPNEATKFYRLKD